ncbi:hypothetical protein DBW_1166 [Desulfuromonas sp. DDH964]|uniref:hypothetical protein n=1 Tax=Desulfuromonas sp. DDH964 TaxID=1823759 RepID=UPI00078E67CD|nr:hypothetical protein [Desulfuromonas sp. DDH964]AMV71540.1 hypothetical protein DBW_1166 [Desulfuromonas sp. DDH964]
MRAHSILLRRFRKIFALTLLVTVLAASAVVLFRDRLLQEVVRPLLVRELGRRFQAEVGIERLLLDREGLQISGVRVLRPGDWQLEMERLGLGLGRELLTAGRLPRLVLVGPKIRLFSREKATDSTAFSWPESPPFAITEIECRDGELSTGAGRPGWRFAGRGKLGRQWELALLLRSASNPEQRLTLATAGTWAGTLQARIDHLAWGERELLQEPLRLTLEQGKLVALSGEVQLAGVTDGEMRPLARAFGTTLPGKLPWRIAGFRLRPELANGAWRLDMQLGAMALERDFSRPLLQNLVLTGHSGTSTPFLWELSARLGPAGDPLSLAGQLSPAPAPTLELTRLDWRGQSLLVRPLRFSPAGPGRELSAALQLAQLDDRALRPLLALAGIQLPAEPQWSLQQLVLEPAWDGRRLRIKIEGGSGEVRTGERTLRLGPFILAGEGAADSWNLNGEGELGAGNLWRGTLHLGEKNWAGTVDLRLPALARLPRQQPGLGLPSLAGELSLLVGIGGSPARPELALLVRAGEVTLPRAAALTTFSGEFAGTLSRAGAKWRLRKGRLDGALAGALSATLAGRFQGELDGAGWSARLKELAVGKPSWMAPDGLSALLGERLKIRGEAAAAPASPIRFALDGELAGGELLFGAYYFPLAEVSARFGMRGTFAQGALHVAPAHLAVPHLGRLDLTGEIGTTDAALDGVIELPDLKEALDGPGRSLFGEAFPQLKELSLAGGLAIGVRGLRRTSEWGLLLNLEPRDVTLGWGKTFRLAGLRGTVPLQLGTLAAAEESSARLAWTSLTAAPLHAASGEMAILARPGQLRLPGALHLALAGGELVLVDLELALPPHAPELAAQVRVTNVELQTLTRELGWPELRGAISADLGRLHYLGGELKIAGEARIEVFGGEIELRNMQVRELFSPYPVFLADIDYSGIDLYRLTSTLAFGEMNGVVDGHIHQLRLFGTTPTHFAATLHSRESGTRNISVKALNNLSILSQGGLSAALSRGIYRFIDFYRYRSIGLACTLDNDLFRLRGTAREGSDRYLVYGGWLPPRIDVIATSPAVSFREMVRRLKRLDRAGTSGAPR